MENVRRDADVSDPEVAREPVGRRALLHDLDTLQALEEALGLLTMNVAEGNELEPSIDAPRIAPRRRVDRSPDERPAKRHEVGLPRFELGLHRRDAVPARL